MTQADSTMPIWTGSLVVVIVAVLTACSDRGVAPTSPIAPRANVRFDYRASTTVRPDLPPSTQACVSGVGRTHIHPSWRNFDRIEMQAAATDLWHITFTDVPIAERLSIRVSDPNVCAENPTGAATLNVFANDIRLVDVVPTPGSGTEPGLAFTVDAVGGVSP